MPGFTSRRLSLRQPAFRCNVLYLSRHLLASPLARLTLLASAEAEEVLPSPPEAEEAVVEEEEVQACLPQSEDSRIVLGSQSTREVRSADGKEDGLFTVA